jgi:hypothetical protein
VTRFLSTVMLYVLLSGQSKAWVCVQSHRGCRRATRRSSIYRVFAAPRYGPMYDEDNDDSYASVSQQLAILQAQKRDFRNLLSQIREAKDPQHIPSILARRMDLLLNMSGEIGTAVCESILKETKAEKGDDAASQTEEFIDIILSFAEDFVQETQKIDRQNKELLGMILKTLADKEKGARDREEALDALLAAEKDKFTPGFLRHIEGECDRIASAPKMTPESIRLLEILRLIQTRVLEELGKDLGEAAQVLGQLIGYESKVERLAVLEAGLTVRGPDFARELLELTEEALEGFQRVPQGSDQNLVKCVTEIDERTRKFLGFQ